MLCQFITHHLGTFLHTVLDLLLAEQHHIVDPGYLDQDQPDQGKTDQHSDYGKNAFQTSFNRFVIYCIRFIFTPLTGFFDPTANVRSRLICLPLPASPAINLTSTLTFIPGTCLISQPGWLKINFNLKLNYD